MAENRSPRFPLFKMSGSKKTKLQLQQRNSGAFDSPCTTGSESESSPANSPFIPRRSRSLRSKSAATNLNTVDQGRCEVDRVFSSNKKCKRNTVLGSSTHCLDNPKNVQHLLDLLEQPECRSQLTPLPGQDGPLHSLVSLPRGDKEKVDLLVALLTCDHQVDINCKGTDGMSPLHYAVQANDLASVRVLLSFGADVNAVNFRRHTPLDLATLLWLAYEKNNKVKLISNKLETVNQGKARIISSVWCNVNPSSPLPSPLLRRIEKKLYTRQGSESSWEYVEERSSSGSEKEMNRETEHKEWEGNGEESLESSLGDSRELTSTVMPFRMSEVKDEALQNAWASGDEESIATILELLYSVHAQSGQTLLFKFKNKLPLLPTLSESVEFQSSLEAAGPFLDDTDDKERSVKLRDFVEGKTIFTLYEELEFNIARCIEGESSLADNPDLAIALTLQEKELFKFRKTARTGMGFEVRGGSRLLFLDGGGVKGLAQLEVLRQLEEATGRKVTQLFDWIIGSSIGGIIALCLVYAKKSVKDIQRLMFQLKDKVFANPRAGFAFNTKALEKKILDEFGPDMRMCDVKKPKVLIGAVNKTHAPPQLHFFNNCFNDNFSQALVWKVARYTSAAPIFFTEFEGYVDGGVLANNPCEYGLSAIQRYHREHQVNLPIAMVVSLGTGIYPPEELGRIDAQEFLFFGKHWFNFSDNVKKRAQNLLSLLTNALVESEIVAKSCGSRCVEQNIPYYRFSPHLSHVIGAGETDNEKLLEMMWQTRVQTPQQGLTELVDLFQYVAEASRKDKYRHSRIQ